jgi:O-antigen/teichoic acid export membrane protein
MGWTTLDQALSSITNFAITVLAARVLTPVEFGAFGLAFSIALFALGLGRALVTEPLLSRPTLAQGGTRKATYGAVTGSALAFAVVCGVASFATGVVLGSVSGRALLGLALILPGLLLQDAWRYCFISQGNAKAAVVNDSVWVLAQLLAVAATVAWNGDTSQTLLMAWGGPGLLAGILGCLQARAVPELKAARKWVAGQRDLGARYVVEFATTSGASHLTLIGLGAIAGLPALGAIRAGQTFFGPLFVLFGGIYLAVVPEAARHRNEPARMRQSMARISVFIAAGILLWTLVGVALPDATGRQLFGETWPSAHDILLPLGLALTAGGLGAGPFAGLRALAAARESLRARLLGLPGSVGAPLVGAAFAGAPGFAIGLTAATAANSVITWWQFDVANGKKKPRPADGAIQHRAP